MNLDMTESIESPKDDMYLIPEDTPINKATLLELDLDKQREFIKVLQDRRTRIKPQVERARKARDTTKAENKLSQADKFNKLADKLEKMLDKIDAELTKAEKIADEIKIHRMVIGDYDE